MLRATDYRNIARISHECRDLGDDPHAWRMHLAAQIARLTRPSLMFVVEMDGLDSGNPVGGNSTVEWGWDQGFNPEGWWNACKLFERDPFYSPAMNAFFGRLMHDSSATLSRTELITECEWQATPEREPVWDTLNVDHLLFSFHSLDRTATQHNGLICMRETGSRDFTEREKAIIHETQQMITPLVGHSLARFDEPSACDLTPRTREVLRCLLEGDGDKQIAARLGISPFTVNQHTKTIYKHYGVQGRTELLARWIRRRWKHPEAE